jgi:hypothetical protein
VGQTWQSKPHFGARAVVEPWPLWADCAMVWNRAKPDLVWVHNDPALYHRLVIERRWAKKHGDEWLYQTLRQQLRP